MNCDDIRNRLPDLLIGDLAPSERSELEAHVALCPACAEEVLRLSEAWTHLALLPVEKPSPVLSERFYAMLEAERNALRGPAESVPRSRKLRAAWSALRLRPRFQFAAALVLLAVGVGGGFVLNSSGRNGGRAAELRREVDDLRQTVTLTLLRQPSSSDRLLGVGYSERMDRPAPRTLEALLHTLETDPSVNVRLAAADALYLFAGDPAVKDGVLRALPVQDSPLVQVALIDLLVGIRERRAAEALKALVLNARVNPDVRKKAELGIRQLSF